MNADKLLLWMSARTRGSWQQFRAAVEELRVTDDENRIDIDGSDEVPDHGLPLYQDLRLNLQRLGHAEFSHPDQGIEWRITPPSLAIVQQNDGWIGIVVGARSVRLLDELTRTASSRIETQQHPACPSLLRIHANQSIELVDIANRAGFYVQHDAPRALLNCLPTVDDIAVKRPAELPLGTEWRIENFDPILLRWQESDRAATAFSRSGLFRFSLAHQRYVFLCDRGSFFRIPAQVGKFVIARRRRLRLIQYDFANQNFFIPSMFRPPFLVERALILCSGRPPYYEARVQAGGRLQYTHVSAEVAALAASILRQELR